MPIKRSDRLYKKILKTESAGNKKFMKKKAKLSSIKKTKPSEAKLKSLAKKMSASEAKQNKAKTKLGSIIQYNKQKRLGLQEEGYSPRGARKASRIRKSMTRTSKSTTKKIKRLETRLGKALKRKKK